MNLAQWFEENPELFSEWDSDANKDLSLDKIGHTSKRKAWWVCKEGHKWQAEISSRTRTVEVRSCPYCSGKKVLEGYNDLATVNKRVLKFWDFEKNTNISPMEVSEFSKKVVWWKCEKGHSWQQAIQVLTLSQTVRSGCPYCYGRKVEKGFNDLLFLAPDVAKEWCFELNSIKPDEITAGSKKNVWWKCELGHTWKTAPFARTGKNKSSKCPYCSNVKVWQGFNDLATVNPRLADEWCDELNGDLKPTMVSKGSHKKVWWKCSVGHVWQAVVYSRAREFGTGCPVCAGVAKDKRPDF